MTEGGSDIESPETARARKAFEESKRLIKEIRQVNKEMKPISKRKLGPDGKLLTEEQAQIPIDLRGKIKKK